MRITAGPSPKARPATPGSARQSMSTPSPRSPEPPSARKGPGGTFPAKYQGQYFFMDFVQGWIKILDPDHPKSAKPFATGLSRPVDLAFAPDGSLFVLLRDAWVIDDKFEPHTGSLLKIRHASGPEPERRRRSSH